MANEEVKSSAPAAAAIGEKPVAETQENKNIITPRTETKVDLPELKEVLRVGLQFGHEAKRWNPKFREFIFTKKNGIHIIDVSKTMPLLQKAGDFLAGAFAKGPVLFLGTKRQAADLVGAAAQEAGAHFVTNRWAGGLMTNFEQMQKSLNRLNDLEKQFAEGVVGRTKYEVAQMRKDWERLQRLYGGVKNLKQRPAVVVVIDPEFESGAVRECNYLDIPTVALVDTNSDPTIVDYPIPANDDAIGAIKLILDYLSARMAEVETTHRVTHKFVDYSKAEIVIRKAENAQASENSLIAAEKVTGAASTPAVADRSAAKGGKTDKKTGKQPAKTAQKAGATEAGGSGILGRYQQQREAARKS